VAKPSAAEQALLQGFTTVGCGGADYGFRERWRKEFTRAAHAESRHYLSQTGGMRQATPRGVARSHRVLQRA